MFIKFMTALYVRKSVWRDRGSPYPKSNPFERSFFWAGSLSHWIIAISVLACPPWAKTFLSCTAGGSNGQFVFAKWASFTKTGFLMAEICRRDGSSWSRRSLSFSRSVRNSFKSVSSFLSVSRSIVPFLVPNVCFALSKCRASLATRVTILRFSSVVGNSGASTWPTMAPVQIGYWGVSVVIMIYIIDIIDLPFELLGSLNETESMFLSIPSWSARMSPSCFPWVCKWFWIYASRVTLFLSSRNWWDSF